LNTDIIFENFKFFKCQLKYTAGEPYLNTVYFHEDGTKIEIVFASNQPYRKKMAKKYHAGVSFLLLSREEPIIFSRCRFYA
jgi:hypothetical protein